MHCLAPMAPHCAAPLPRPTRAAPQRPAAASPTSWHRRTALSCPAAAARLAAASPAGTAAAAAQPRPGRGHARAPRAPRRAAPPPPAAVAAALAPAPPAAGAAAAAVGTAVVGGGLSELIAVVLGYAVLIGSLFRSAPQIAKVVKARSCEGLSLTSVVVELLCYSVVVAYNLSQGYAFNTFGEVAACWIQDVVLIALILRFSRAPAWAAALLLGGLAVISLWLLSPACPPGTLAALQASSILTMALGSRLPQIVLNWRRGDAGMLSVVSCGLNVAGNAARVFTTLVLTRDPLLLGGILTQGTMNCVLLYQSIDTSLRRRRGLLPPISKPAAAKAAAAAAAHQQERGAADAAAPRHAAEGEGGGAGDAREAPSLVPQPAV